MYLYLCFGTWYEVDIKQLCSPSIQIINITFECCVKVVLIFRAWLSISALKS